MWFIVLPVQLSIQTTESLQNKVGKEKQHHSRKEQNTRTPKNTKQQIKTTPNNTTEKKRTPTGLGKSYIALYVTIVDSERQKFLW